MIDGFKLSAFLEEKDLSAEEFWLLYRIMVQEPINAHNIIKVPNMDKATAIVLFSQRSQAYQNKFSKFLNTDIHWIDICYALEKRGYIEIWDKKAPLKLHDLRITSLFKDKFLGSDLDKMFDEVVELYPKKLVISNGSGRKILSSMPEGIDKLKDLYNELILKGANAVSHTRFMLITERYVEDNSTEYAVYKLSNYFNAFESIAATYETGSQFDQEMFEIL